MTDATKHTPGPWSYDGTPTPHRIIANSENIAQCFHVSGDANDDQLRANARLIAAAPELLKLLDRAVNGPWKDHDLKAARAAINKAKGKAR